MEPASSPRALGSLVHPIIRIHGRREESVIGSFRDLNQVKKLRTFLRRFDIQLPISGDRVTLLISHHSVPWRISDDDFNCTRYFYLDVRDGADRNAPILGHYCTNQVPASITSSVNCSAKYCNF